MSPHRSSSGKPRNGSPARRGGPGRWRALAGFGFLVSTALLAVAATALASAINPASTTAPTQLGSSFPGGPYFAIACSFSHRNNDDPIVFPKQPGRSHNHTYVGNRSVDASTTPSSLVGGGTSCESDADSSAYWMPTLFDGGDAVHPLTAIVYYTNRMREPLTTPPAGLVMIAGNAEAGRRQPKGIVAWSCGAVGGKPRYYTIPTCRQDRLLQFQATFPNCWNGRTLDSADHRSHMRYASRGQCPATHPVPLPTISLIVLYPPVSPRTARLSSGRWSLHADFMNGWDQDALARLVAERSGPRRR